MSTIDIGWAHYFFARRTADHAHFCGVGWEDCECARAQRLRAFWQANREALADRWPLAVG